MPGLVRCQRRRLENILGRAPREVRRELKQAILEPFHAADYEAGIKIGREVLARYRDRFPGGHAMYGGKPGGCARAAEVAPSPSQETSDLGLNATF